MLDNKNYVDFTRCPWYMRIIKTDPDLKDLQGKNARKKVNSILNEVEQVMGSFQFGLYGTKNAWIVKPGGKSRGRGIQVHY